jgi:hypothetical protein
MPLRVQEAYAEFSPDGVGMQLGFEEPLVNDTPFIRHVSDIYPKLNNLEATADQMAGFAKGDTPEFLVFRWILQTPSTLVKVRDLMQEKYSEKNFSFVDPYTFFDLYERHLSGEKPGE